MALLGFFAVLFVVMFGGLAFMKSTVLGSEIENSLSEIRAKGWRACLKIWEQYNDRVRPALMRVGWGAVVALAGNSLLSVYLLLYGARWFVPLVLSAISLSAAYWIVMSVRGRGLNPVPERPKEQLSAWNMLTRSSASLIVVGLSTVAVACFDRSAFFAVYGSMLFLMGVGGFWVLFRFLALVGVKSVDFGEGVLEAISKTSKIIAIATSKTELEGLLDLSGPNLADQEDFSPAVDRAFRRFVATFAPFLALAITFHHPLVLAVSAVPGMAIWFVYQTLEHTGTLTASRKKRAALTLEIVVYVGLGIFVVSAVLKEFSPESYANFAIFLGRAWKFVNTILAKAVLHSTLVFTIFSLIAALYFLWPKGERAVMARHRKIASIPLTILLVGCTMYLSWLLVGQRTIDKLAEVREALVTLKPDLKITPEPSVVVEWSEMKAATGYTLERRETAEAKFTVIGNSDETPFEKGVHVYEDITVEPGKTYFYRLRAKGVGENNADKIGTETQISIPVKVWKKHLQVTSKSSVIISWDEHPAANGYILNRRRLTDTKVTDSWPLAKGVGTFEDNAVAPGVTYFYSVTAKGAGLKGVDVVSSEEQIKIPEKEADKPVVTTSSSSGRTAQYSYRHGSTEPCQGKNCSRSPELQELCVLTGSCDE